MNLSFDHIFIAPSDFDKSLEFYTKNLGLEVKASWGDNPGDRGAVLKNDQGLHVVIAEPHGDDVDHAWEHGINGRRPSIHLNTDDLKGAFERVTDQDSVIIPPEVTHWGTKWFLLKDPDDNIIAVNTPSAE